MSKGIKVFHFNTHLNGGAAIAARRVMESTIPYGADATFFTTQTSSAYPARYKQMKAFKPKAGVKRLANTIKWRLFYREMHKYTAGKQERYEKFSFINLPVNTPLPTEHGQPDVVHLHWISEMLDFPSFFKSLPADIPLVWMLHDMNPFTGGCHYTDDCLRYTNTCGNCPQINSNKEHDITTDIQKGKIEWLAGRNLHVVANSYWTQEKAEQSTIMKSAKSFQTIHYPINIKTDFYPRDKKVCKEVLGIGPDTKVVAFGAFNMTNHRKGLKLLQQALKQVYAHEKDLVCIVFGSGTQSNVEGLPPFIYTDFVSSPALQSIIYSAADIFVFPSLQEAFGQTALEAISCATPVLAFDGTGVMDIVKDGITGRLAAQGSEQDLADKILEMLRDNNARLEMGMKGREYAVENFSFEVQGKKHYDLYSKVMRNQDSN